MPTMKWACQSPGAVSNPSADELSKLRKCSAYCANFETHLEDYSIHMPRKVPRPMNERDIMAALSQDSPSFSASSISTKDFEKFEDINTSLTSELHVLVHLFPAMCGDAVASTQLKVLFAAIAQIAGNDIATPKPDVFYGSPREDLNRTVLENLLRFISPTLSQHAHVVPNFYVELKGPDGGAVVLERQACFDGAHGARAMHYLQNYGVTEPSYDGNAYKYSATYHPVPGVLQL